MEYIPSDIQITMMGYLADSTGLPYTESANGNVSTFTVSTLKSSLPTAGFESFLKSLSEGFVNTKYTISASGNAYVDSKTIDNISTTEKLIPRMSVVGPGIQVGTILDSVRSTTSVKISKLVTVSATPVSVVFGTQGWDVDYSSINYLVTVVNFDAL